MGEARDDPRALPGRALDRGCAAACCASRPSPTTARGPCGSSGTTGTRPSRRRSSGPARRALRRAGRRRPAARCGSRIPRPSSSTRARRPIPSTPAASSASTTASAEIPSAPLARRSSAAPSTRSLPTSRAIVGSAGDAARGALEEAHFPDPEIGRGRRAAELAARGAPGPRRAHRGPPGAAARAAGARPAGRGQRSARLARYGPARSR